MSYYDINYHDLTVTESWDIPVFQSLPELVPEKSVVYNENDNNNVTPKFLRDLSMYDVFNNYDEFFKNNYNLDNDFNEKKELFKIFFLKKLIIFILFFIFITFLVYFYK
jgi:hypothetical protein